MYARYFTFSSTPENRKAIEDMANEAYSHTKSLNGFLSATYVISEDELEYGSFSVWESKEAAEAAGASIREKFMSAIGELATAPPEVVVMEVYDPR
jgi:quinol monooxygenase YgiN